MNIEQSIPELKTYYRDYPGDLEILKQRILNSVGDMPQSPSSKPRFRLGKALLIGIPCVLLLMGAGVAYHSTTMTKPHHMTQQQIDKLESQVSEIGTHYGYFVRTDQVISLPSNEIVHDLSKVTAETKEIILPYGIFIK